MARGYEDLSRRGLIQLGKDYDAENDAALMQYLADNDEKYEDIRFCEKIINKADEVASVLKGSKSVVKEVLAKQGGKIIDAVVESIVTVSDSAEKKLTDLSEKCENI